MPWSYELRTYTPAGVALARVSDFGPLTCTTRVNSPGLLQVSLKGDHSAISALSNRSHLELWRRDATLGIGWYRVFTGLYLSQSWQYNEVSEVTLHAPGLMWLLRTRVVNWAADTANRTKFTGAKAETILKTLVDYNACANATVANGRKREGAITGLTIQADGANGSTLDWACFGENLLGTCQKLAQVAGGDFDVVKTAANAYQFQWFTGQLGTDRTASVIFAVDRGNMGEVSYSYPRIDEATVACVWGKDQKSKRVYVTRTGDDYNVSTNNIEVMVNAQDCDTTAALNTRGDEKLEEARAREEIAFKVLQTPACQYGLHYFMGDLVKVVNPFTGASTTQKINAATINLSEGGDETIDVETDTP